MQPVRSEQFNGFFFFLHLAIRQCARAHYAACQPKMAAYVCVLACVSVCVREKLTLAGTESFAGNPYGCRMYAIVIIQSA